MALLGRLEIDVVGAGLLLGAFGAVAAALLYWAACRWAAQRRRMRCAAAGALRLAAARGDLRSLELLSHCPHFDVDADVDGFTALLAAAVQGKDGVGASGRWHCGASRRAVAVCCFAVAAFMGL